MVIGEGPARTRTGRASPSWAARAAPHAHVLAVDFDRERDCYIANVVKCRPERNRNPEPDEVAACNPFLMAQIDTLRPAVILTLGNFAAQALLGTKDGITKLRGRAYDYRGSSSCPPSIPPSCCATQVSSTSAWPGTTSSWPDRSTIGCSADDLRGGVRPAAPGAVLLRHSAGVALHRVSG